MSEPVNVDAAILSSLARATAGPGCKSLGPDMAGELRRLAARLRRLAPSNRNPEAYFIEKDSICHELRKLAAMVGQ